MNKEEIIRRLTILDFLAVDLQLYLNIHYDDKEAIEKYNSVVKEADSLRALYEKCYGPIYSFRSESNSNEFTWIDNPWPWENSFNFNI